MDIEIKISDASFKAEHRLTGIQCTGPETYFELATKVVNYFLLLIMNLPL